MLDAVNNMFEQLDRLESLHFDRPDYGPIMVTLKWNDRPHAVVFPIDAEFILVAGREIK